MSLDNMNILSVDFLFAALLNYVMMYGEGKKNASNIHLITKD